METGFHKSIKPAINKWRKPYLQAFMGTVHDLREYARHQESGVYITPVFDDCQEFMGQARKDYEDKNQVSNSANEIQLEAADFLAWEYRVNAEEFLQTGNRNPGVTLASLLEYGFGAKPWTFEMLEYLRKRVEAVESGVDPETVPTPMRWA